jgi:hypothetical protein
MITLLYDKYVLVKADVFIYDSVTQVPKQQHSIKYPGPGASHPRKDVTTHYGTMGQDSTSQEALSPRLTVAYRRMV